MDHLARAEALRQRATACRSSADETTSAGFQKCYRMLADHYAILARLEEDYAAGSERLRTQPPRQNDGARAEDQRQGGRTDSQTASWRFAVHAGNADNRRGHAVMSRA